LEYKKFEKMKAGPYSEVISQKSLNEFRTAIGSKTDDQFPPTFFTVFRQGEFQILEKVGLTLSMVLHGEQEYEYFSNPEPLINAGEPIHYDTELSEVIEKGSGKKRLIFFVFETRFHTPKNEPIAISRTTIVRRETGE
jgi:hypothetical protein